MLSHILILFSCCCLAESQPLLHSLPGSPLTAPRPPPSSRSSASGLLSQPELHPGISFLRTFCLSLNARLFRVILCLELYLTLLSKYVQDRAPSVNTQLILHEVNALSLTPGPGTGEPPTPCDHCCAGSQGGPPPLLLSPACLDSVEEFCLNVHKNRWSVVFL